MIFQNNFTIALKLIIKKGGELQSATFCTVLSLLFSYWSFFIGANEKISLSYKSWQFENHTKKCFHTRIFQVRKTKSLWQGYIQGFSIRKNLKYWYKDKFFCKMIFRGGRIKIIAYKNNNFVVTSCRRKPIQYL